MNVKDFYLRAKANSNKTMGECSDAEVRQSLVICFIMGMFMIWGTLKFFESIKLDIEDGKSFYNEITKVTNRDVLPEVITFKGYKNSYVAILNDERTHYKVENAGKYFCETLKMVNEIDKNPNFISENGEKYIDDYNYKKLKYLCWDKDVILIEI